MLINRIRIRKGESLMKKRSRIIGLLLAGVLFFSNTSVNYQLLASESTNTNIETNVAEKLSISSIPDKKEYKDLSKENQELINAAVTLAKESGTQAAEYLNQLQDSELVEIGIKAVLDAYYSAETIDEAFVKEFAEVLTMDNEKEITAYTEARKERDNKDNLEYVAGELLLVFDKDTTKEEIKKLCEYISDSYEIILDNDFVIDESLSEEKKERLKALETYKSNIVVLVKLDLDQTVQSAKEEFETYECVVEAGVNGYAYTDDLSTGKVAVTAPTNVKAVKTESKTAKITWKKSNAADGYEIYLKKGKEKYKKIKTINSAKKTSYQLKNISNKNTYQLKIRSYKKVNCNKAYSTYTKPVTLNMKKELHSENIKATKNIILYPNMIKSIFIGKVNGDVKWTTSNEKIASILHIDGGKVTLKIGNKTGSCKITAKTADKTYVYKVNVKSDKKNSRASLVSVKQTKQQIKIRVKYHNRSNKLQHYGYAYHYEKFVDGKWEKVKENIEMAFTEKAISLPAQSSVTKTFIISSDKEKAHYLREDFTPGIYRLRVGTAHKTAEYNYVIFTIK